MRLVLRTVSGTSPTRSAAAGLRLSFLFSVWKPSGPSKLPFDLYLPSRLKFLDEGIEIAAGFLVFAKFRHRAGNTSDAYCGKQHIQHRRTLVATDRRKHGYDIL